MASSRQANSDADAASKVHTPCCISTHNPSSCLRREKKVASLYEDHCSESLLIASKFLLRGSSVSCSVGVIECLILILNSTLRLTSNWYAFPSYFHVHWLRSWLCTGRQSRPGLVFQLVGSDLVHDPMAVSQAKDSQLFCLQAQAFDSKVATAIAKSTSDCSQQGIGNCKAQNQAIAQAVQEAIATVSLPDLLSCPFSCTSSHALIKENMPWRRQCVLASTMHVPKLPLILTLAVNRRRKD